MDADRMFVLDLIDKYGQEFYDKCWEKLPDSQYGNLESMVLYGFIRESKPITVAEIGVAEHGRSTFIIQKALLENGQPFCHLMSDYHDTLGKAFNYLCEKEISAEGIFLLPGQIQHTFQVPAWNKVDFLFIDADHTRLFAEWYFDSLIPLLKPATWVHIHDTNLSGDWVWRERAGCETEELMLRHDKGTLPLEKVAWLEDWCINRSFEIDRERIYNRFPDIGKFPALELPYACSASYWKMPA
mgnify:CR=1 FL=1